jgi:CubicO group peptidase (beta-lactamase class C family)/predicted aspartyl protease
MSRLVTRWTLALMILVPTLRAAPPTLPATEAGRRTAAFLEALAKGGEPEMRAFLEANVSPEALQRRSLEERLKVMQEMRANHGRLELLAVVDTKPDHVDVEVRTEDGGRLSIGFLFEPGAPHRLLGLRVMDIAEGGGARRRAPEPEPTGLPLTDEQVVTELRALLETRAAQGTFSGAVLLAKEDRVLFREAYGLASREAGVPNRPETRFNLGSINKSFTRLAIEQLAAAGRLQLSDTLDLWVPEYPADKARKITLQHLIEHRGGTGDFFGPRYDAADRSRLRTLRDWLPLFADLPLAFEPGTRQQYSNAGYLLLGLVVEKASGQSYDDYVREQIFAPAGMSSTAALPVDDATPNRATGYTRELGASLQDNRRTLPFRGSSAGGGYSTVDDLLRFANALRSGKLGSMRGGLGVAGGAPGINAALEMRGDYTAVVLANLDPPAAEQVASQLRDLVRRVRQVSTPSVRTDGKRAAAPTAAMDRERGPMATSLPKDGVDVPMVRVSHLPAVHLLLNGQGPFLFEIDTGAAGTARLDSALAQRLGLATVGEVLAGDPSGKNARAVPVVSIDSIELGGARFTGLTAAVRDYRGLGRPETVDGILGFAFFTDCLLTLDYPGARVRLSQGALPAADGREVLDFRSPRGVPSVTLRVAGQEMEADVDAGAQGGLALPETLAATLPLAGLLEVVGRARTTSNTFEIRAAPLAGDVQIGGLTLSRPRLEFQPLFPQANIGSRVLRDLVVTFDLRNHRLQLRRPATAAPLVTRPASPRARRLRGNFGSGRG